jgi:GTP:adenosylcobinamide-phosphate guanylyltransferase
MDAIVTAGGIPQPGEPLYEYTQGKSKALLDIHGKPMIQWVLDALCAAKTIDKVIIIGLPENSGLACEKLAAYLPNQGGMIDNIRTGVLKVMEINPSAVDVLLVSSDIPTINSEMVDWVVNETMKDDLDAYYNVITKETMEARFPGSNRTYTHLKGMDVCGGDMNVIRTSMVTTNTEVWEKIIASRKSPLKQASLIGFDTLFLLLLRRFTVESAVARVAERLHMTGRGIVCPYAEVGMDVDKPNQLEMVRADMAKRIPA